MVSLTLKTSSVNSIYGQLSHLPAVSRCAMANFCASALRWESAEALCSNMRLLQEFMLTIKIANINLDTLVNLLWVAVAAFFPLAALLHTTVLSVQAVHTLCRSLGGYQTGENAFTHHGKQVLILDYVSDTGVRVQDDIPCERSDKDPICLPKMVEALTATYTRPETVAPGSWLPTPFVWIGGTGRKLQDTAGPRLLPT